MPKAHISKYSNTFSGIILTLSIILPRQPGSWRVIGWRCIIYLFTHICTNICPGSLKYKFLLTRINVPHTCLPFFELTFVNSQRISYVSLSWLVRRLRNRWWSHICYQNVNEKRYRRRICASAIVIRKTQLSTPIPYLQANTCYTSHYQLGNLETKS